MAVTRIWPIKNNIHQVVSYAANKSKTDLSKHSDLIDALHYAGDKEKTNLESEQRLLGRKSRIVCPTQQHTSLVHRCPTAHR